MNEAGYIDIRITFGEEEGFFSVQSFERTGADTGTMTVNDIAEAIRDWGEYPYELVSDLHSTTHGLGVRE